MRTYMNQFITMITLLAPSAVFAYGEGGDIPTDSRAMQLMVNEARSDIQHALKYCGANCTEGTSKYGAQTTPVWWSDDFHRAAQFHATMLASVGQCLEHASLCKLKDNLNGCDGTPSCACTTGSASCSGSGTATFDRIKRFAKNASGEIIFTGSKGEPFTAFYSYLHEDGNITNGHRAIILDGNSRTVGFGDKVDRKGETWDVGDFGSVSPSNSAITAGAYYKATSYWPEYAKIGDKKLWFKMHYYANTQLKRATVSIAGQCLPLSFVVGNSNNGVYGIAPSTTPANCSEFYYEAQDANGNVTRYPSSGVLLYNCNQSWKTTTSNASCIDASASQNIVSQQPSTNTTQNIIQPQNNSQNAKIVDPQTIPNVNQTSPQTTVEQPKAKDNVIVIQLPDNSEPQSAQPSREYREYNDTPSAFEYDDFDDIPSTPNGNSNYSRSTSTKTTYQNGRRVTTTTIYENGKLISEETVIEEDNSGYDPYQNSNNHMNGYYYEY